MTDEYDVGKFSRDYFRGYAENDHGWWATYRRRRWHYAALIRKLRKANRNIQSVVEVGCGVGLLSYSIMQEFGGDLSLTAGDMAEYAVEVTRNKLAPFKRARVLILDARSIALPSASFDAVVCFDVVEHLPDPICFLREAFRLLQPGGVLLFSTPNPDSLGSRLKGCATGLHQDSGTAWFATRDVTHISIQNIDVWRRLCGESGFAKVQDGADFLWDFPYFKNIPLLLQKLVLIPFNFLLSAAFGFWSWRLGENYYGIWRKPDGSLLSGTSS